jgi:hypothetical protein
MPTSHPLTMCRVLFPVARHLLRKDKTRPETRNTQDNVSDGAQNLYQPASLQVPIATNDPLTPDKKDRASRLGCNTSRGRLMSSQGSEETASTAICHFPAGLAADHILRHACSSSGNGSSRGGYDYNSFSLHQAPVILEPTHLRLRRLNGWLHGA